MSWEIDVYMLAGGKDIYWKKRKRGDIRTCYNNRVGHFGRVQACVSPKGPVIIYRRGEAIIFRKRSAKKWWPSPTKDLKNSGPPFTEVKKIVTLPND